MLFRICIASGFVALVAYLASIGVEMSYRAPADAALAKSVMGKLDSLSEMMFIITMLTGLFAVMTSDD